MRAWLLFLCIVSGLGAVEAPDLTGTTGTIALPGGQVVLTVGGGLKYLNPEQTEYLLETVWGNPEGAGFLGALVPDTFGDGTSADAWAALLSYDPTGHVKDDDAASLNYDDLLKQLREDAAESNKTRKEKGFEEVTILGWATPPHYDGSAKTLYWAKEVVFGDASHHTLNYELRVLGREGVLDMNVVAGIDQLTAVEAATPQLLKEVAFSPGQRYADYQEGSDHLAEFGVAGLVLGGLAVKAGLLKVILTFLAASWKFLLIGFGALAAWAAKFFSSKKKAKSDPAPQDGPEA